MTRAGLALAVLLAACAGGGAFSMNAADNDPAALERALARETRPVAGKPSNGAGKPLIFLVTAGAPRKLLAWDVAANQALWSVEADVSSRVAVGARFVAAVEGKNSVVARSLDDGRVLWRAAIQGSFNGLAADGDNVYVVLRGGGKKGAWRLVAYAGGEVRWEAPAEGALGAPAARGGLVYMPFLTQWLSILDGNTGTQLTRIRQTDEAVNFVRTTSDGVYYGSQGVFALDERSASGTRRGAAYARATLPDFVKTLYYFDAFNPVQSGYSAFDRNRILWRASLGADGALGFQDNLAIVFTYRFFFAFDVQSGALVWANQQPRTDVVAAEHVGPAILTLSAEGEVAALDPKSGARTSLGKVGARVLGATFDADGFVPTGTSTPTESSAALGAMIADKDSRFTTVKLFAVTALAQQGGPEIAAQLIRVLLDAATSKEVYAKTAEVLVARAEAGGLPAILAALGTSDDFLSDSRSRSADVLARAAGAVGSAEAAPALAAKLETPGVDLAAVEAIARAVLAVKGAAALPGLRSFLLVYRADPAFAANTTAIGAVIDALLGVGSGYERALVTFVAADARTLPEIAAYARTALGQTAK